MTTFPTRLEMMRQMPRGSVGAEVGVLRGDFAAELLTTDVQNIFLIDSWTDNELAYEREHLKIDDDSAEVNYQIVKQRFMNEIAISHVTLLKMPSRNAADHFLDGELDWVYLDADHTYAGVIRDLLLWQRAIKPGGFLCGHDYTENPQSKAMGFGVKRAVDEFCRKYGWEMIYTTDEEWPSYALRRKQ